MELRHMRYFVAVAEHLHFGRAAEALITAQPSLSRQIGQLEEELGVRLFDRTNRRVELTEAGRLFLIDARRTLESADASMRHARENADGTRGELRIGFIGGAMLTRLPSILRAYGERFPNVTLIPHAMSSLAHVPALRAGSIDVAWAVNVPDPDIVSQSAASDPMLAVLPSGHRLEKKRKIALKELTGERLILMSRILAPLLYEQTLAQCIANGYTPHEVVEVQDDMVATLGLVAAGLGVGVAPFPWSVIHVQGLVFRDLTTTFYGEQTLSWHRDRYTPMIRAFIATAMEVLSK